MLHCSPCKNPKPRQWLLSNCDKDHLFRFSVELFISGYTLLNSFSISIEIIMWFLSLVDMLYYIYWFTYIEPSLHHRDASYLVMVHTFLDLLCSICQHLIEDFYMFIILPIVLFLGKCYGFGIRIIFVSRNESVCTAYLPISLRYFRRSGIRSSLNFS